MREGRHAGPVPQRWGFAPGGTRTALAAYTVPQRGSMSRLAPRLARARPSGILRRASISLYNPSPVRATLHRRFVRLLHHHSPRSREPAPASPATLAASPTSRSITMSGSTYRSPTAPSLPGRVPPAPRRARSLTPRPQSTSSSSRTPSTSPRSTSSQRTLTQTVRSPPRARTAAPPGPRPSLRAAPKLNTDELTMPCPFPSAPPGGVVGQRYDSVLKVRPHPPTRPPRLALPRSRQ